MDVLVDIQLIQTTCNGNLQVAHLLLIILTTIDKSVQAVAETHGVQTQEEITLQAVSIKDYHQLDATKSLQLLEVPLFITAMDASQVTMLPFF